MIRRMLLPIDGTRSSTSVVSYAAELAKRLNCRVTLLLVQPMHEALLPHPEHHHEIHHTDGDSGNVAVAVATPEEIRNANERYVERHVEELDTLGVEATGQVRLGDPVEEILRAALELRCDLIAMATRHRGRFARPEPGSVAEEILWQSRLPVLLVADG